jgi:glycosyltransferase involved in cell wall biosynthesis
VPSVLHLLPHPGGGGEKYIDLLESMPDFVHERTWLSAHRSPLRAAPAIAARRPRLAREARRHDLIQLHGDMTAMIALPLLRRQPAIVSTHGMSFLRRARGLPLRYAHRRWAAVEQAAAHVVCSSHDERRELLALDVPGVPEPLVIPNGIELPATVDGDRRRSARAELGLGEDEIAVLYLGLLDRYKDPMTAVHAALMVRERGAPVTLLVAGDGPLLADVRAHEGDAVRPLGHRDDPELLLGAADVFVMPSTREGASYALLEAMGQGLAILASDGAGIPEMVGSAAIVVPVGDVAAFAEGLLALASSSERRTQLGSAARTRVREQFNAERFSESMRALYEEVLGAQRARSRG